MSDEPKKSKRGGKRPGAGRKPKSAASPVSRGTKPKRKPPSAQKRAGIIKETPAEKAHDILMDALANAESDRDYIEDRRERFAAEYVVDLNATKAAKRAGYSPKTAHTQGSRLLKDAEVSAKVEVKQRAIAERLEITADMVVRELALIGFSNMLDYIRTTDDGDAYTDLSALTRDQAAAIQEVTIDTYQEHDPDGPEANSKRTVKKMRFKLSDKRAALVDIGKHLGLFREPMDDVADGIASLIAEGRRRATTEAKVQAVH